jgi:hypothetical protein
MTRYEVRKLGVGGVLDQAIAVVRDHFSLFLVVSVVAYLPLAIVNAIASQSLQRNMPPEPKSPEELLEFYEAVFMPMVPLIPLWALIAFVVWPLTSGAVIWTVSQKYLGEPVTFQMAWKHAFGRGGALVWTSILYMILLMVGMAFCFVPYFIVYFWFFLFAQIVVLERGRGVPALIRGKALMSGHYMEAIVISLLLFVIAVPFGASSALIPHQLTAAIVQAVAQSALMIVGVSVVTVFYYSCRCDQEDFDLLRMAEAVSAAAAKEKSTIGA